MKISLVVLYLALLGGLIGIIESGAEDVFMEATRPDFQKIPIGIFGFRDGGTRTPTEKRPPMSCVRTSAGPSFFPWPIFRNWAFG